MYLFIYFPSSFDKYYNALSVYIQNPGGQNTLIQARFWQYLNKM